MTPDVREESFSRLIMTFPAREYPLYGLEREFPASLASSSPRALTRDADEAPSRLWDCPPDATARVLPRMRMPGQVARERMEDGILGFARCPSAARRVASSCARSCAHAMSPNGIVRQAAFTALGQQCSWLASPAPRSYRETVTAWLALPRTTTRAPNILERPDNPGSDQAPSPLRGGGAAWNPIACG